MKRLLLTTAGLLALAGSAAAQPDQDLRGHQQNQPSRESHQAPANRPAERQAPQQNVQRYQPAPQNRGYNGGNGSQGFHPDWRGPGPNGSPVRVQPNTQYQRSSGSGQVQTYRGGQYQYRSGGQYQYRNGGYRGGANVRLSGNWWRGRPGFNGYYGRREGYWFAPGWGYYRVDPRWWDFDWVVGSIVPYDLQSYVISDYWDYGLPAPPYGCEWIFLGDQIVLMDLGSGQIVQIAGAY